jgi:transcriptional regulator of acetoin/glycerol metabolism
MKVRLGPGLPPRLRPSRDGRLAALQVENTRLRSQLGELRQELRRRPQPDKAGEGDRSLRTLEEVERDHIVAVLEACEWRIKGSGAAAELLGLNPGTLYSRMRKLGIARPKTTP